MNSMKLTLSVLIVLFTVSCTTILSPKNRSEYLEGSKMATEFAKKDAMSYPCFLYPWLFDAERKARKYTKLLQEQGRSEIFIRSFSFEYQENYFEFIDLYCGP